MTDQPSNPWADIIGPCYTAGAIAPELRWTETGVREAADSLDLLELETDDRVLLYPSFQLWTGRPVAGLGTVLRILSSGTHSAWTWAQWLNTPLLDEDGAQLPSNIDLLRTGHLNEVCRDARHDAAAWSA